MRATGLKRLAVVAAATMWAGWAVAQTPANLERGTIISYTCSGCHGHDFKGVGGVPLLRGRNSEELARIMAEFRSGERYSTVMARLVRGLTPDEVSAVSAYLASLR